MSTTKDSEFTTYVFHRVGEPTEDKMQHSIEQISSVEGLKTFDGVHRSVWTWADKLNLEGSIIFVCGDFVGKEDYCDWNQLMDLVIKHGCEIGWHTWTHRRLPGLDEATIIEELSAPFDVDYFAYPHGDLDGDSKRLVEMMGYLCGYSTTQGDEGLYSLRREYL